MSRSFDSGIFPLSTVEPSCGAALTVDGKNRLVSLIFPLPAKLTLNFAVKLSNGERLK
jgi:hypothetical protein